MDEVIKKCITDAIAAAVQSSLAKVHKSIDAFVQSAMADFRKYLLLQISSSINGEIGGSSVFGQNPAFGGFGSTTQSRPFGSSFQQSQPAFGSSPFGSSPFGASSQPAFGAPSTPVFWAPSTPAFGATSTPAFGSASTPTFGNTGSAFGVSSAPAFCASGTPAFGSPSTLAFCASSAPAFFGATSAPFSFGSSPAFGQSTSAFFSTPFDTATTDFGAQSSPFGCYSAAHGSRVIPYAQTREADSGGGPAGKLQSISAIASKEKSHEELRWEDYQLGDKGGPNLAGQPSGGMGFYTNTRPSNAFSSSAAFGQSSTNRFAPKTSTFGTPGFGRSTPSLGSSLFGASTSATPFGSTLSQTSSSFGSSPDFRSTTSASLFGTPSSSTFGTSIFSTTQAQGTTSFATGINIGSAQSCHLIQSRSPSLGPTVSAFWQAAPVVEQGPRVFGQSNAFGGNMFSTGPQLVGTSCMGFNPMT